MHVFKVIMRSIGCAAVAASFTGCANTQWQGLVGATPAAIEQASKAAQIERSAVARMSELARSSGQTAVFENREVFWTYTDTEQRVRRFPHLSVRRFAIELPCSALGKSDASDMLNALRSLAYARAKFEPTAIEVVGPTALDRANMSRALGEPIDGQNRLDVRSEAGNECLVGYVSTAHAQRKLDLYTGKISYGDAR